MKQAKLKPCELRACDQTRVWLKAIFDPYKNLKSQSSSTSKSELSKYQEPVSMHCTRSLPRAGKSWVLKKINCQIASRQLATLWHRKTSQGEAKSEVIFSASKNFSLIRLSCTGWKEEAETPPLQLLRISSNQDRTFSFRKLTQFHSTGAQPSVCFSVTAWMQLSAGYFFRKTAPERKRKRAWNQTASCIVWQGARTLPPRRAPPPDW